MALRSAFFNSVNGDRKYDASRFAEYFASFIGNGVFPNPSNNLQVIANDDMTVTVKAGKAWINGYILINDDDYILEVEPADGVLNRIDRVVARYDMVDREIRLEVKKGTFASTPVAPALQRDTDAYELALADILVSAGVVSVTQANITDQRLNAELCGIVHGTVDQIDVTTLYNQYTDGFELKKEEFEQAFMSWFATLQDVLDEETAGNLLNMINDLAGEGRTTETVKGNADALAAHLAEDATNAHQISNIQGLQTALSAKAETKADIGLGNVENIKNNYEAVLNPSKEEDETKGYSVGSMWVNVISKEGYLCTNANTGNAKWLKIGFFPDNYYYHLGFEYEEITGGWVEGINENPSTLSSTQSKDFNNLYIKLINSPSSIYTVVRSYNTFKKVSLQNIRYLVIELENFETGEFQDAFCALQVINNKTDACNTNVAETRIIGSTNGKVQVMLNVTSLTGEYFIRILCYVSRTTQIQLETRVYKVWAIY